MTRFQMAFNKWLWGNHHLNALNRVLEEYHNHDSPPWSVATHGSLEDNLVKFTLHKAPPIEISFILGDIVAGYRTALDYAACALVEYDSTAPLDRIYFPYGRLNTKLNSDERRQVKGACDAIIATIEAARAVGGPFLFSLQALSNQDKHRLIIPTVFRQMPMKTQIYEQGAYADFVPDLSSQPDVWEREIADGDIIAMPNILHFKLGFVVEKIDGAQSLEVLNNINQSVRLALEIMAGRLGGDTFRQL